MAKKKGCLGCLGVIVLLVVIIGVIGALGSNNNSSTSSSTNSSSTVEKKDGLTYQKFVDLQMGSTIEDVNATIGKDGVLESQNNIGDIETKSYRWTDGAANMNCMFQNNKMVSKAMADFSSLVKIDGKDITLEQFNQINMGMSYEEVCKVLGREGLLASQSNIVGQESTIYIWMNKGGTNLNVTFTNGTAQMKAQVGLK